jgi:hypothetical protein
VGACLPNKSNSTITSNIAYDNSTGSEFSTQAEPLVSLPTGNIAEDALFHSFPFAVLHRAVQSRASPDEFVGFAAASDTRAPPQIEF